jgi:hypothetical protein
MCLWGSNMENRCCHLMVGLEGPDGVSAVIVEPVYRNMIRTNSQQSGSFPLGKRNVVLLSHPEAMQ